MQRKIQIESLAHKSGYSLYFQSQEVTEVKEIPGEDHRDHNYFMKTS